MAQPGFPDRPVMMIMERERLRTAGAICPERGQKLSAREKPEVVPEGHKLVHRVEAVEIAARQGWR